MQYLCTSEAKQFNRFAIKASLLFLLLYAQEQLNMPRPKKITYMHIYVCKQR